MQLDLLFTDIINNTNNQWPKTARAPRFQAETTLRFMPFTHDREPHILDGQSDYSVLSSKAGTAKPTSLFFAPESSIQLFAIFLESNLLSFLASGDAPLVLFYNPDGISLLPSMASAQSSRASFDTKN